MGSYPTGNRKFQKNSKKIQKFRKHHHTFYSSQNRLENLQKERKLKKKNHSDGFLPDREQEIPKKQQKYSKIQKTPSYLHFKPKQVGKYLEREKIKKIVLMCSYPTRNRKFQKNCKKVKKIRKHHHTFFSSQNRLGKAEKERKKRKSFRCVHTRPVIENSKKNNKKIQKI